MILRIEPGWVQVNDALSRHGSRPRRHPPRPKDEKGDKDRGRRLFPRDRSILDLVA